MSFREEAFLFACGAAELVGLVALPAVPGGATGVLVVVGGPQYRAGSHRQFVLLSRHLAGLGIACMRFDWRGMGDATGEPRDFDAAHDDIRAAVEAFLARAPGIERVVLWGLCDGASAACLYAPRDPRVAGLVLLNPWVRTAAGQAKTYLRHYYRQRLFSRAFWKKLFGGRLNLAAAASDLLGNARRARRTGPEDEVGPELADRMVAGLEGTRAPVLVILSGRDYVAREFEDLARSHKRWSKVLAAAEVARIEEADHTFSRACWRDRVAECSHRWVTELDRALTAGDRGPGTGYLQEVRCGEPKGTGFSATTNTE